MTPNRLLQLADRLAANDPVDWEFEIRSSPNEEERALVSSMRQLAKISALHFRGARDGLHAESTREFIRPLDPTTPTRWGRLEKLQHVGSGSFGNIFKAWDPLLQIWVALKLARRDAEITFQRMLDESRLLASLRHEHIVRIYGADMQHGEFGIWMEYVEGRTLDQIVKSEGPRSEAEVIEFGRALALALAEVHRAGIIHQDIKAHNVMREAGGRIVLMDFGIGSRTAETLDVASTGTLKGTPYYLAPEVLGGEPGSIQSDVYSLGVLLFYLVTKRYPVEAETLPDLRNAHRVGRRAALTDIRPSLSPKFCSIIEKALDADPTRRFQSAGRMAHALASLQERRVDWHLWVPAAAALGILLVALAFWNSSKNYTIESTLLRAANTNQQLLSGSRVQPGDRIFLEVQASKSLYLYVFDQDTADTTALLFPLHGLEPANPLPANVKHHLPGGVDSLYWVVTSTGGRERFLIVASPEPLKDLEAILENLPPARFREGSAVYPAVDLKAIGSLRGILGLSDTQPATSPPEVDLLGRIAELTSQREKQRGIWVRRIELENP